MEPTDSILDENGHLNLEALTTGQLVMRFDPETSEMIVTWVPDDPDAERVEERFPVVGNSTGEGGGDVDDFATCMQQNSSLGLKAFLKCSGKLVG